MVKYRLFVGIAIASGLCHIVWWTCAIKYNWFALFPDRYYMTLTMILGGCVAGEDYFYNHYFSSINLRHGSRRKWD